MDTYDADNTYDLDIGIPITDPRAILWIRMGLPLQWRNPNNYMSFSDQMRHSPIAQQKGAFMDVLEEDITLNDQLYVRIWEDTEDE